MFKRRPTKLCALRTMIFTSCCVGFGCSNAAQDDSSSASAIGESEVVGSDVSIHETRTSTTDGQCATTAQTLEVRSTAMPAATTAAINTALRAFQLSTMRDVDCSEPHTWRSSTTVVTNRGGVLSIAEAGVYGYTDAAMLQWYFLGHNYSVPSGKELRVEDLLTAQGLAVATRECGQTLATKVREAGEEDGADPPELDFVGVCAEAIDPVGRPSFSLERTGIHAYPTSLPAAYRNVASDGVIVRWDKLPSALRTPLGANVIRALLAP
jgi:hypothetical protein